MKKIYSLLLSLLSLPVASFADATFNNGIFDIESVSGAISVSGKTDLHITARENPFNDATIDLADDDSWLYFDAFKPSVVNREYLKYVTIAGEPAVYPDNVRLSIWGSGCVVIPNGTANDKDALTVYDEPNCQGNSKTFEIHTYHNNLGDWDNKIMSFKLKRGYMATFANNPSGTGHSRCFIADDADLVVDVMPDGFVTYNGEGDKFDPENTQSFVSFIRVFRWEWVGKKGWAGWSTSDIAMTNVDSYYPWSADKHTVDVPEDDFYVMDHEFVPIKQQRWWPGWDDINNLTFISHLLGYNEPDMAGQADIDFKPTLDEWPNMFKSGLRIGSPATADPNASWLTSFFHYVNLCNYRCDFAVAHIYKYFDANGWQGDINNMVKHSGGRPCWITEYNNGANWTGEQWPGGNRSANQANLQHQKEWTEKIMPDLDTIKKLERAHFYNWVEDCRAFVIDGKLTPAGEVFSKHISHPGYDKAQAYDHIWKIAPPFAHVDADVKHENVTIKFYDHNGETGRQYDIYRLQEGGYVLEKSLLLGIDYRPGETVTYTGVIDQEFKGTHYYKIQAISYKGTKSLETEPYKITGAPLGKPNLKKVSASGEEIVIEWNEIEGATSYRIKRGTKADNLKTIEYNWDEGTIYHDKTTKAETVYYYQVGAQNTWSETSYSTAVRIYSGVSGIADVVSDEIAISASNGCLTIESPVVCILPIFSIDGRKVRDIEVCAGTTVVTDMAHGLYIINRQKVAI